MEYPRKRSKSSEGGHGSAVCLAGQFDVDCSMASNSIDARLHAQIASGIDPEKQTQGGDGGVEELACGGDA